MVCDQKVVNHVKMLYNVCGHHSNSEYGFIHLSFSAHCADELEQVDNNLKSLSEASQ